MWSGKSDMASYFSVMRYSIIGRQYCASGENPATEDRRTAKPKGGGLIGTSRLMIKDVGSGQRGTLAETDDTIKWTAILHHVVKVIKSDTYVTRRISSSV